MSCVGGRPKSILS